MKLAYISVPSQVINSLSSSSLQSLLISPKKCSSRSRFFNFTDYISRRLWFLTLFLFFLLGTLKLGINVDPLITFSPNPCATTQSQSAVAEGLSPNSQKVEIFNGVGVKQSMVSNGSLSTEEGEFWKQPDGLGYRSCLNFSGEYKKASPTILNNRRKYLVVVVSGGMNQERNQIVDVVVIARILGAALVVPILQVNVI